MRVFAHALEELTVLDRLADPEASARRGLLVGARGGDAAGARAGAEGDLRDRPQLRRPRARDRRRDARAAARVHEAARPQRRRRTRPCTARQVVTAPGLRGRAGGRSWGPGARWLATRSPTTSPRRDLQGREPQWTRAKGADGFCPYGPWITTADEIPDPHTLALRTWVNGELRQDSNTSNLIFSVPELIEFISETCTLQPGDVILTGTPAGVGMGQDPPAFLAPATSCASRSSASARSSTRSPERADDARPAGPRERRHRAGAPQRFRGSREALSGSRARGRRGRTRAPARR